MNKQSKIISIALASALVFSVSLQFAPTVEAKKSKKSHKSATQSSVYYKNCTAVKKAGKAPLYKGDPGYRLALDRDHDGIACEK
ncbi:hypothetical protein ABH892_000947 [Paenibacillus sp. RC254]